MLEDSVRHCLARLTDFDGRTSREHYQPFVNAVTGPIVLLIVFFAIGGQALFMELPKPGTGNEAAEIRFLVLATLGLVAVAYALLAAATVRRLHDVGKSGWWAALPVLGGFLGLVLMIFLRQPGDPGPNRWGPPLEDHPDPDGFRAEAARADAKFAALLEERARAQSAAPPTGAAVPAPAPPPGPPRRTFGRRGL
jgi:uncharacterized membrane protein YhaH (DUF805 family)